jgi:hypothetical protein
VLEKALGERAECAEFFGSGTRIGGYNSKWGLALPAVSGIRRGGVGVLTARERIPFADLTRIECDGIGERRAEGFGGVLFLSTTVVSRGGFSLGRRQPGAAVVPRPGGALGPQLQKVQRRMVMERLGQAIDEDVAQLVAGVADIPRRSLLGRLRVPLQAGPAGLKDLQVWLGEPQQPPKLRPTALHQLEACRLNPQRFTDRPQRAFLDEWMRHVLGAQEAASALHKRRQLSDRLLDERQLSEEMAGANAVVQYLTIDRLLRLLTKLSKKQEGSR